MSACKASARMVIYLKMLYVTSAKVNRHDIPLKS